MLAIVAKGRGGPEVFQLVERPEPEAYAGQVLVDVDASALNRADLLQARGSYPPPEGESDVFGLEAAGTERRTGKKVCFLLGSGGCAEVVAVDRRMLMPVPKGFTQAQAGAIPEVWLTAFLNLFIEAKLEQGERVLIHAAASGVGTAAIQLAKMKKAHVIATTRTQEKLARCLMLGADQGLLLGEESFAEQVLEMSDGEGVDVILDVLGGKALTDHQRCLRTNGRLVTIALLRGSHSAIDMGLLLARRQRVIGSTLRSRPIDEKAAITARFVREVMPGFDKGELQPVIDSTYRMADIRQAAERLASNLTVGKVALEW